MPLDLPNRQTVVNRKFAKWALAYSPEHGKSGKTAEKKVDNRIREVRKLSGLTLDEVASRTGLSIPYISRMEVAERNVSMKNLRKLADALGTTPDKLLSESPGEIMVPVVGYVRAGAEAYYYGDADNPRELAPMPPGGTADTVAVEVRGTSLGSMFDRWLVYYDQVQTPPSERLFRRLCVVGLADGRVLVKRIIPGSRKGLYHLESQTEGILEDQPVQWAALVKAMTPR